jgi:hypothetical protein
MPQAHGAVVRILAVGALTGLLLACGSACAAHRGTSGLAPIVVIDRWPRARQAARSADGLARGCRKGRRTCASSGCRRCRARLMGGTAWQ